MNNSEKETKMIRIDVDVYAKLEFICKTERRTRRQSVAVLIENKYSQLKNQQPQKNPSQGPEVSL